MKTFLYDKNKFLKMFQESFKNIMKMFLDYLQNIM